MGKHREATKWFAGRIEMGRHMIYTCDRCHAESKAAMGAVMLPTGRDNVIQRWDMCRVCLEQHMLLLKDQEGQLRAFVAGATLPPEANLPNPYLQSAYAPHAGMQQQGIGIMGGFMKWPGSY